MGGIRIGWLLVLIMVLAVGGASSDNLFEPPPLGERFPAQCMINPKDRNVPAAFRTAFELPKEPIFRAVVNVSWSTELHVNGQRIPDVHRYAYGWRWYWTVGVDIAKYLRPGKNCIGIKTLAGPQPLFTYLEGDVVLASGRVIHLASDKTWKVSAEAPEDWSAPGFDDANWESPKATGNGITYNRDRMPAYTGCLVIENPYQEKLLYLDRKPIALRVLIPAGLAKGNPTLAFRIHQVESEKQVAAGEVTKFKVKGAAAVCELVAGQLLNGVYVISLALKAGDEVMAERLNEPFIVVGRIAQKEVPGNSFEEGMGLELEDIVNCADPNDPHPYLEGGGATRIVKHAGIKYREAGPNRGGEAGSSFFAYQIKFQRVDEPYLVVFEYPDDAERWSEFGIYAWPANPKIAIERKNIWAYGRESGGAACGGRFPLSGKMRRFPILYFPNKEEGFLVIKTASQGMPGAASRILIYRVGDIPAVQVRQSGERLLGFHTERGYSFHRMLDGNSEAASDWEERWSPIDDKWQVVWGPKTFALWFKTIERHVRYLRFSGQNVHVVGCIQYDDHNTPYAVPTLVGGKTARLEPDFREIMAQVFGENDLALMGSMELVALSHPQHVGNLFKPPTDEEVAQGADTVWTVSREGKQPGGGRGPGGTIPNIFHPKVQAYILRMVREVCEKLAPYPAFKGLYFMDIPWQGAMWGFVPAFGPGGPLEWGYEDVTIRQFEKDTGLRIPVDAKDPERFAKRHEWIMANAKEKWIEWRCRKVRDVRLMVLEEMRKYRKDLRMICAYHFWEMDEVRKSGLSYREYVKQQGLDLSLYRDIPGLAIARYVYVGGGWGPVRRQKGMQTLEDPDFIAAYSDLKQRVIGLKNIFDENLVKNPKYTDEWPFEGVLGGGPAESAGEHFGWQFARAEADSDPEIIIFGWGDNNILPGHEQEIRNFAKGFLPLPKQEMSLLTGPNFDPNVVVREARVQGRLVFSLLNPSWWQDQAEVRLQGTNKVFDLATGARMEVQRAGKFLTLSISLPPYSMRSFAASGGSKIVAAEIMGDLPAAQTHLTTCIEEINSQLALPKIKNVLSQEEINWAEAALRTMQADLAAQRYLPAWRLLTHHRMEAITEIIAHADLVKPWMVIGPFENDEQGEAFRRPFPVEQGILAGNPPDLKKEYDGLGPGNKPARVKWAKVLTDTSGLLDFDPLFTPNEWVCAYAFTQVYSPKEREATLSFGSDDGGRVWLNGKLVIDHYEARAAKPGQDVVQVTLNQGWNPLLVKVEERIGGWRFYLDFLGPDGKPLRDLEYSITG